MVDAVIEAIGSGEVPLNCHHEPMDAAEDLGLELGPAQLTARLGHSRVAGRAMPGKRGEPGRGRPQGRILGWHEHHSQPEPC
jgi:hypothetical protein